MTALTDRARKLYDIAHKQPESEAIATIYAMLQITRVEGIDKGVDLATEHKDIIERSNAHGNA